MLGLELMVRNLLASQNIDVAKWEADIRQKIADFESNVDQLNNSLISIDRRLKLIMDRLEISEIQNGIGGTLKSVGIEGSGQREENKIV